MYHSRTAVFVLILLLAVASLGNSALAITLNEISNSKTKVVKSKGAAIVSNSWTLGCKPLGKDKKLICEASRIIGLKKTGKVLLSVFVTPWAQAKAANSYVLRLQLPHGLNIPAGVQIQIDKTARYSVAFQTTSQSGIYARIGLTKEILASLQSGKILNVKFSALNGSNFSIPVSLDGFSAVFAKM